MASRYDQYQLLRRLHEELYSTIAQYEVWPLRLLVCLVLLLLTSCSVRSGRIPPAVIDGSIDVTTWDFERDGPVILSGDWEVELEGRLGRELPQQPKDFITVSWSRSANRTRSGHPIENARWAKLSFRVVTATPLILDFDSRPLSDAYFVRCEAESGANELSAGIPDPSKPWQYYPLRTTGSLVLLGRSRCSILVAKTGARVHLFNAARLLGPRNVNDWSTGTTLVTTSVMSSVCCLFALLLVILDRKDPVPRWSALYLVAWTTRLWLAAKPSYLPSFLVFASGPWIWFRLEFLSLWLSVFAMVRYGEALATQRIPLSRWVSPITLGFVCIAALFPFNTNLRLLLFQQMTFIGFGFLMMRALYRKSRTSRSAFVALLGLGVVLIGGGLYAASMAIGGRLQSLCEAMMTSEPIFQMVVLCIRTADARNRAEKLAAATTQFVPREFLHALGHDDVTTAKLGDAIARTVTVLFADIRNFTVLSEKMSPEETFKFLNSCLSKIGPHIRSNYGFVDKYIGDAIMALFPRTPSDAVHAAIAMQREVRLYNNKNHVKVPLAIGIGIHVGPVMMGTIGEELRFEATVISDAVNLTARIETLTKQLGCNMLISADVAVSLREDEAHFTRKIGTFAVKGKSTPVELVEIFDTDDEALRTRKMLSRSAFDEALRYYMGGNLLAATTIISKLAADAPGDGPLAWWSARLQKELSGVGKANSSGVVQLDEK